MQPVPVFVPITVALGFDPVWFGVLFIINMEVGFLTSSFGYNLFYLRGVAPARREHYGHLRSIVPFVLLMLTGLAVCIASGHLFDAAEHEFLTQGDSLQQFRRRSGAGQDAIHPPRTSQGASPALSTELWIAPVFAKARLRANKQASDQAQADDG